MQQIPHLDVVEGDIDPLLADPANFVLEAVECEAVNEWVPGPNLGTHGAAVGNTQQVVEGLGYAWRLTRDDAVADTIFAALPHLAQPRLASTPEGVSGIGNRLCSETRSMPAFLADTEDLLRREAAAAATA